MRPSTAAQCVAYIACTELPQGTWPEMMPILTSNVTNPASTEMVKEASLEAVGYICQDIVSLNSLHLGEAYLVPAVYWNLSTCLKCSGILKVLECT